MPKKLLIVGSNEAFRIQEKLHHSFFRETNIGWECQFIENPDHAMLDNLIEAREYSALILDEPYKKYAARCADIQAASARLACGAGLLVCKDTVLLAYELEGSARATLLSEEGFDYRGALVLVCGEKPSALADVLAASLFGARKIIYLAESKQKAQQRLHNFVTEFGKLAYATIDLPPSDEHQLSFRDAYDQTSFSFGSYHSSTQIFEEADFVIDHRKKPSPEQSIMYATFIQETLIDIFHPDFVLSRRDILAIMAAAYKQA